MFSLSDMIRFYVQKNADIKKNICRALQCNALRGHLHHTAVTFIFHHAGQKPVDLARFRRGVFHRLSPSSIIGFDRSDHSYPVTGFLQNPRSQKCCCRLAIRACDADHLHPFCRMIKESCRERRKRFSGISHCDHTDISVTDQFVHIHLHVFCQDHRPRPALDHIAVIHNKYRCTMLHRLWHIFMTIVPVSIYANKKGAFFYFFRMTTDIRYLPVIVSPYTFV